jgi:isopenicillin N synthase-like dioxygenase
MSSLPVIDLSNFEERKQEIVRDIENACKNVGFFYVVNHGIPKDVVQKMFQDSKDFFKLPTEVPLN